MSISHSRYNLIRDRIFDLYKIINGRTYGVWIAPKSMMTIDEIRERSLITREGYAQDTTYFDDPQLRQMKIPLLIDYIPNFISSKELGFKNANTSVIEIYESIQEYIQHWCEIIREAPEFGSPPITELRKLESLAWYIFPIYKSIKPYVVNRAITEEMKNEMALQEYGLAGLGSLFSSAKEKKDLSFISHLDDLGGPSSDLYYEPTSVQLPTPSSTGSGLLGFSSVNDSSDTLSDWIYRG